MLFNLVSMGGVGEVESLTKMGSSHQVIRETFKSRFKRLRLERLVQP